MRIQNDIQIQYKNQQQLSQYFIIQLTIYSLTLFTWFINSILFIVQLLFQFYFYLGCKQIRQKTKHISILKFWHFHHNETFLIIYYYLLLYFYNIVNFLTYIPINNLPVINLIKTSIHTPQMFKIFSPFFNTTQFEKLLQYTTSNNINVPDQGDLRKIIRTFSGNDSETRAQIAFGTLINKMNSSASCNNWLYFLKNLILLDKMIMERLFLDEISEANLAILDEYEQRNYKHNEVETKSILKAYWSFIKQKATVMKSKNHIMYFNRSQREDFLKSLTIQQILNELEILKKLFISLFLIISYLLPTGDEDSWPYKVKQKLEQSPLISYLNFQILYSLFILHSCQSICIKQSFTLLCALNDDLKLHSSVFQPLQTTNINNPQKKQRQLKQNPNLLKKFRNDIADFKRYAFIILNFIERHKNEKNFNSLTNKEVDLFRSIDIVKKIQKYLDQWHKIALNQSTNQYFPQIRTLFLKYSENHLPLQISSPTFANNSVFIREPRKKITPIVKKQSILDQDPFENWNNTYTDQFPDSNILTIDLIQQWKKTKQDEKEYELYMKNSR